MIVIGDWCRKFFAWLAARRERRHRAWSRKHRIIMPAPDPRCDRPKPEASGKVSHIPRRLTR
jgi:hypothetical protein